MTLCNPFANLNSFIGGISNSFTPLLSCWNMPLNFGCGIFGTPIFSFNFGMPSLFDFPPPVCNLTPSMDFNIPLPSFANNSGSVFGSGFNYTLPQFTFSSTSGVGDTFSLSSNKQANLSGYNASAGNRLARVALNSASGTTGKCARYVKNLEKVIESERKIAILQIKLEGFNTFNVIYGMDYSNKLLRIIAKQFIYMMDMDKTVYHMEGETFVFILKKAGRNELVEFEQQVRCVLETGIMVEGKMTPLKMASGAVLLENYQGESSSVRGQVNYALNHSLNEHQGQLVIFNDEVQTSRGVDLELMKVIHQSVRNGCKGFYLEYQPIVDTGSGSVVGAEALVRWSLEPYGKVSPGVFIEWMEKDPSMYQLGNYVLKTALIETRHILEIKSDFFVNVNVSIRQLEQPEFRRDLLKIIEETDFPANHLCLELTERCKDFPLNKLNQDVEFFHEYGIRIAMDDYGTGSASSSIVMEVPMDEIKIDMSFIRGIMDNPKNQAMVQSILYFAAKAGISTCLEGVENEELQNYLRNYNATWFQGYYYAKPLSARSLEEMIISQKKAYK